MSRRAERGPSAVFNKSRKTQTHSRTRDTKAIWQCGATRERASTLSFTRAVCHRSPNWQPLNLLLPSHFTPSVAQPNPNLHPRQYLWSPAREALWITSYTQLAQNAKTFLPATHPTLPLCVCKIEPGGLRATKGWMRNYSARLVHLRQHQISLKGEIWLNFHATNN